MGADVAECASMRCNTTLVLVPLFVLASLTSACGSAQPSAGGEPRSTADGGSPASGGDPSAGGEPRSTADGGSPASGGDANVGGSTYRVAVTVAPNRSNSSLWFRPSRRNATVDEFHEPSQSNDAVFTIYDRIPCNRAAGLVSIWGATFERNLGGYAAPQPVRLESITIAGSVADPYGRPTEVCVAYRTVDGTWHDGTGTVDAEGAHFSIHADDVDLVGFPELGALRDPFEIISVAP